MPLLFSREAGSGHTLIFIHGFCDTHEAWWNFVPAFTSSYRVITPDLPGFGNSPGLAHPFTIDDVAARVIEWMDQEKLEKPVVIGHSLGGYVALAMLNRDPARIRALGLFHSTAYADPPERKEVRNKVIAFVNANGVQPYIDTFVPGLFLNKDDAHITEVHERASRTRKEILTGFAQAMRDRPDHSDLLRNNEIPKLLIGGVGDSIIAIDGLREQAKTAKNALFFEVAKAGHMGFFEAKSECQSIVTRFTDTVFSNNLN